MLESANWLTAWPGSGGFPACLARAPPGFGRRLKNREEKNVRHASGGKTGARRSSTSGQGRHCRRRPLPHMVAAEVTVVEVDTEVGEAMPVVAVDFTVAVVAAITSAVFQAAVVRCIMAARCLLTVA